MNRTDKQKLTLAQGKWNRIRETLPIILLTGFFGHPISLIPNFYLSILFFQSLVPSSLVNALERNLWFCLINRTLKFNFGPFIGAAISFPLLFLFFSFLSFFFRATPTAYGKSQAGVKLELQLLAYVTATATPDPSHIYYLHHSSQQCWILNPLKEARDWTCLLMNAGQIRFRWAMMGTPIYCS